MAEFPSVFLQTYKIMKQTKTGIQFILFFTVGSVNFFLRQITFTVLSAFGLNVMFCNFVAFTVSVIGSYLINGNVIFKKQENENRVWWKVFLKLYFVYAGTGLVLSGILIWFFLNVVKLSQFMPACFDALNLTQFVPDIEASLIAKGNITPPYEWVAKPVASVITVLIITPLNFIVNKYWAYKPQK